MRRFFYFLAAFGIIFFISGQNVLGCRCAYVQKPAPEFVAEQRSKALAVFSGEVLATDFEKVRFKIQKIWKGEIKDELQMSTGGKKINDELFELPSSCNYNFQKGEKYLVFAFGDSFDEMKATKCNLTNKLDKAKETEKILDSFFPEEKATENPLLIFFEYSYHKLLADNLG